jgi:hypothetical protein
VIDGELVLWRQGWLVFASLQQRLHSFDLRAICEPSSSRSLRRCRGSRASSPSGSPTLIKPVGGRGRRCGPGSADAIVGGVLAVNGTAP